MMLASETIIQSESEIESSKSSFELEVHAKCQIFNRKLYSASDFKQFSQKSRNSKQRLHNVSDNEWTIFPRCQSLL